MIFIRRLLIVTLIFLSIPSLPQNKKEGLNLDRITDDLKYRNGRRFVELEKYDKALEELNEYLEIFIYGAHRDEAYSSIAKIHFMKLDYQKAAVIYRKLFEEFSNRDSGVEGYYNMGVCYQKMGYDSRAAEVFNDIVTSYPESTVSGKARIQVDLLKILSSKK
jgi:TolA-binding protein